MNLNRRELLAAIPAVALVSFATACGGSTSTAVSSEETNTGSTETDTTSESTSVGTAGLRTVSATDAAELQANAPENLVILDVRTLEEFEEARIDGAVMLDFYREDFAAELAELDPDVPYLLYCRSGNRSGQTIALMEELGFSDVANVDGGILAWNDSGLDLVAG